MKFTLFVLTLMKRSAFFLIFLALFVTINVHAQSYKRGILVEDFTSQYCQFSPRGDHYIDSVCKLMPYNAIALVWHNGYIHDDFTIRAGDTIAEIFRLPGVPEILSNRGLQEGTPEFSQNDVFFTSQIQNPATEDANLQILITGETYDYQSRKIECDIRVSTNDTSKLLRSDTAQYYVAGVITEDSIVSWQQITCEGMVEDTIFTHNNVVRAVGGKIMGDNISLEHGSAILHYKFTVKGEWNPANIKIKAFVGVKSPKIVQRYTVLNAIQTLSNASGFPYTPQLYAAILQPHTGDTINPKLPMSVIIDRGDLSNKQTIRLYISPNAGITWDDIGGFDGISALHYNFPDSFKRKPLQLEIRNLASDTIYARTGTFTIMGTGKKSILSVTTSGYPNLSVDSTYLVFWDYFGDVADIVDIETSVDQKTWKSIATGIPLISGKAGYPWYVRGSSMSLVYIRIKSRDGVVGMSRQFTILSKAAVDNNKKSDLSLDQNYPNPFHSSTRIPYVLPHSEEVTILAHDLLGNEVMRIRSNEYEQAGAHEAIINAENLQSGTYIISLITTDKTLQRKMILQK